MTSRPLPVCMAQLHRKLGLSKSLVVLKRVSEVQLDEGPFKGLMSVYVLSSSCSRVVVSKQ